MEGIIDRFEGDIVVIEIDGETKDFTKSEVDPACKINDVVLLVGGIWIPNISKTKKRQEHIQNLMNDVWED
ncbi:DUF3006 domain-containing protein [Bacillus sp. RO1]|uniref:DUF3006 domain-containing protein n=1 Tax=Bacillus sp. RO1 TaxID=2722703 RepID=UPI0014575412|nr:DUF3006 domain-containing protein [Bacillus sp. RO1]NLP52048.1 DUF3006 domain-containing protein [Bacillus sp. RO1]